MPAPVVVEFLVKSMPAVQNALRTVEQAAAAAERSRVSGAQRASRERTTAAEREARAKERLLQRTLKELERAEQKAVREAQKASKERQREADKEMKDLIRAAEHSAQARIRAEKTVDREIKQIGRNRERENNRLLAEGRRIRDREEREKLRDYQKAQRDSDRFRRGAISSFSDHISTGVGRGISRVGQATMQTAGLLGQLGGGFSIADSVQRAAANSGELEDILNAAYNPVSKVEANKRRRNASEVEGRIQGSAVQFGMERSDIQKGLGSVTGITGDFETALKLMPQLAELSRATGSKFDDMAQAAGNVALGFDDMSDSGKKAEKVMEVMRTLAGQGKAGNVEIRDAAVQAAKIVAAAGTFAGDNADNIRKLGAIQQLARGGGGAWNAASATTAVTAFSATFGKGARLGAFESKGIKVFEDEGKTKVRSPEQLIADALEKTGGSKPEMAALFGSVFSLRAVDKFTSIYTAAEKDKKGSGRKKVLDAFGDLYQGSTMSKEDVADAAKRRVAALDAQMVATRERFDKAVQEKIIPALIKLAPEIEKLVPIFVDLNAKAIPVFVDLIKTIAEFAEKNKGMIADVAAHPVGALIALELTKSFAAAGLPTLLKALLTAAFRGGGAPVPGLPPIPSPVGAGVAGGVAVGAVVGNAMLKSATGEEYALDLAAKVDAFKRGDTERGIAPAEAQKQIDAAKKRLDDVSNIGMAGNIIASPFSDDSSKKYAQYKADQALVANEALIKALQENTAATRQSTQAGGGVAGGAPPAANTGIVQRTGAK